MKYTITLSFFVIAVLSYACMVEMHEEVHKAIWSSYGIDSHIEMFHAGFSQAVADGDVSKCTDSCELAHNINEIVSYNLQGLWILIFAGLFVIIFLIEDKYNGVNFKR